MMPALAPASRAFPQERAFIWPTAREPAHSPSRTTISQTPGQCAGT
jgi:hypothetical protein